MISLCGCILKVNYETKIQSYNLNIIMETLIQKANVTESFDEQSQVATFDFGSGIKMLVCKTNKRVQVYHNNRMTHDYNDLNKQEFINLINSCETSALSLLKF